MIKLFLDNVNISNNVEIDLSFVEKLDMELDEGFVVISHTNREEPFPMFGVVDIFEDNTLIFSGRIAQDNVEIKSHPSQHYNHNVSLIEHTKILERYLVTGKSFTQPIEDVGVDPYTLYDVLEILRTTTKFELFGREEFNTPFLIPESVKEELESIVAPEFNFKDLTLREAINEVFSYLDAIARLDKDSNIRIDKFNEIKNQVNIVTENFRRSQDISNYSTMLSSEINNPVNSEYGFNVNNTEYYPGKNLWTTLRSETLGQFDFSTSFIPTSKPIFDLKKAETSVDIHYWSAPDLTPEGLQQTTIIQQEKLNLDITDNIVERSIFNSLEDKNPTLGTLELTKRNTIVYDYGKKNILVGQTYGLFDIETNFKNVINYSAFKFIENLGLKPEGGVRQIFTIGGVEFPGYLVNEGQSNETYFVIQVFFNGNLTNVATLGRWRGLFRVEYVPIPPSIRYEVVRDDTSEVFVESKLTVNQKMRIVDLERFTANMKGKINQLGTSELILSHKVKNISDTFNIGDFTTDRFIITKKEVITQRDHYIVNYELNKNFNKMSQFMGIDQEIRQYEIGESGRTIDRDLNYNEYIEVFADDNETLTPGNTTFQNPGLFLDTLNKNFTADKDLKYGLFVSPQLSGRINMPIYKISGGGAFGVYTDFESNVGASNRLEQGDSSFLGFTSNRRYVFPVPYADQIGRFNTMFISFYNDVLQEENQLADELEFANNLPLFNKQEGTPIIEGEFFVKKDNRERIKFTILYHLISRNIDEVIIGEKLYTHNSLFIDEPNNIILKKFNISGSNRGFTKRDFNSPIIGEDEKITNPDITINKSNMYIQIEDSLSGVSSWALVDENDIPYLIVNGNKKRVLFDFKSKRDDVSEPGIPEPLRLLRPELESVFSSTNSTTNASSITFVAGNPNDEVVNMISSIGGNTVSEDLVLQNSPSFPIPISNLEPNIDYNVSLSFLPLQGSDSLPSFVRNFSRKTPIPNAFAPTFEIQSFQIFGDPLDIPAFGEVNIYSVDLLVNNPNNYPVTVLTLVNGFNVTNLQFSSTINKVIPADGSDVITITTIDPGDGQTISPPGSNVTLTDIMDPFMFALETYTFQVRLRSSGFTNNWVTPLSDVKSLFIDIDPTAKPDVTWSPNAIPGRIRFNIKNNDSLPVTFTPSTVMRKNGAVINVQEVTDLIFNGTTIQPGLTIEFTANNLQGNEEDVFQLEVEVQASGQNVSAKESANGRLAGKAKRPAIIFPNSTSTNAESFINFQLLNRERYTAKIFYAANTFDGNFTPNQDFVELAPGATSNTLTYTVPSNNQGDLHYIHALTEAISPNFGFEEIQSDSDVRVSSAIQPADLIQQLTVRFLDFSGNVIKTVLVDENGFLQQTDFPAVPTQPGYTSSFWVNVATNTSVGTFTQITQNIDVSRNWTIITYNITYNLNGATNDAANPSTYTVEDSITFQPASRLGYDFEGWFLEPGFATQITGIPLGSIGNIEIYARLDLITLQNIVFTTESTLTSITVTATNPAANPRIPTDGTDTRVRFGLKRVSDGQVISSLLTRQFAGPEEDVITVVFDNLDNSTQFLLFGDGTNEAIRTFTTAGDFVEAQQASISINTVTPVGDKLLRVKLNIFTTQTITDTSLSWQINGVSQGIVSINSDSFTTLSSTLFDTDEVTINGNVQVFDGSGVAGSYSSFIVNGVTKSPASPTITELVENGLDIEIVYT